MSLIRYRPSDKYINTSKIGRPPTDEIQRLRVLAWYYLVKDRSGWSDYKLDIEICLSDTISRRDYAARPKVFERIRRNGTVPERGSKAKRGFDLIDVVDQRFPSTKAVYESPLWELIQSDAPTLVAANDLVSRLLESYGLTRIETELDVHLETLLESAEVPTATLVEYFHKTAQERYDYWLSKALQSLSSDLDRIALLGALFREAYLGMSLKKADILKDLLLDQIDRFFRKDWAQQLRGMLKPVIVKRIVYWAFEPNDSIGEWEDSVPHMLQCYFVEKKDLGRLRNHTKWREFCMTARNRD